MDLDQYRLYIIQQCKKLGFDLVGFASADEPVDPNDYLQKWLDNKYRGDMDYMARNKEVRQNPKKLLPSCQTVIVLGLNYYHQDYDNDNQLNLKDSGKVSFYARGRDYHHLIRSKHKRLKETILQYDSHAEMVSTVDTKPILEKAWAQQAGLGFIGKNTCIISFDFGSYIFLSTLLINRKLQNDTPFENHCGSCTRCIDACPTQAIIAPYQLDATKCISYHTIEKPGVHSELVQSKLSGYIFGCDICQIVCPWNRFKTSTDNKDFIPKPDHSYISLSWLENLSYQEWDHWSAGTPLRRAGFEGLKENAQKLKQVTCSKEQ